MKSNINKKIKNYIVSTGVKCKVINIKDFMLGKEAIFPDKPSFCQLVHNTEEGISHCRQSYLYGGKQAKELGDKYIYFCPYGLVNWAIPIFNDNNFGEILIGGPVLMHDIDNLLLKNMVL